MALLYYRQVCVILKLRIWYLDVLYVYMWKRFTKGLLKLIKLISGGKDDVKVRQSSEQ